MFNKPTSEKAYQWQTLACYEHILNYGRKKFYNIGPIYVFM
jgi:hypothetical protein